MIIIIIIIWIKIVVITSNSLLHSILTWISIIFFFLQWLVWSHLIQGWILEIKSTWLRPKQNVYEFTKSITCFSHSLCNKVNIAHCHLFVGIYPFEPSDILCSVQQLQHFHVYMFMHFPFMVDSKFCDDVSYGCDVEVLVYLVVGDVSIASIIERRNLFWLCYIISRFDGLVQPQSWIPYVHIGLIIVC